MALAQILDISPAARFGLRSVTGNRCWSQGLTLFKLVGDPLRERRLEETKGWSKMSIFKRIFGKKSLDQAESEPPLSCACSPER